MSRQTLTIALVCATPGTQWGGMETHTRDLAMALSARGHKVYVFAHPDYASRFPAPVRFKSAAFQKGRRNLWLRYLLRKALAAVQPDVVHAQGHKAVTLVGAVSPDSTVTVGTVHGTKKSHKSFSKLNGVIAISPDMAEVIGHDTVRLIPNGLSALRDSQPSNTDHPIPTHRPLLLAAGRLEPVKQFDRLIRGFAAVNAEAHLAILGEGSQRPQLEKLISELALENRVSLPGYENHLRPWLDQASACIISSEREGFPYILIEALQAECPVLSTPVSSVSNLLPASAIARSCQTEDITNLLAERLKDLDQLRRLQKASFSYAQTELTLEAMTTKTEAFYYELIDAVADPRGSCP